MDIDTLSLHHDVAVVDDFNYSENIQPYYNDGQPWTEDFDITIASDSNEALTYTQFEGVILPMNDFSIDVEPIRETVASVEIDRLVPTLTPGDDALKPNFNPSHQLDTFVRPVGYEDRNDKRPRTTRTTRTQEHPRQYITNWNAFTPSTPRPSPQRDQFNTSIIYNVRASNIDIDRSDDEIEAFFNRTTNVEGFQSKTIARRKVVHLAISQEASWNDVLALDGYRLGRHRIKVEVDASGFQTDA